MARRSWPNRWGRADNPTDRLGRYIGVNTVALASPSRTGSPDYGTLARSAARLAGAGTGESARLVAQIDEDFREFVAARSAALLRTAYLLAGDWASGEDLLQIALT